MIAIQRFWIALERMGGLKTVPASWHNMVGEEWEHLSYYIRPHGGLATSYPRLDKVQVPLASHYRIVSHSPDYHVGICDVTGDRVELTTAQITNHEVELQKLARDIAQVLGFEWLWQPIDAHKTFRLGTCVAALNDRFPVFVTIQLNPQNFRHIVDRLAATTNGPFLLVAPTRKWCQPDSEALLQDKGSMLLPLCEVVALDNNKRWMATEGAQVLLHEFKERVFQARRPKNSAEGAYQFRLQGNAWTVTYDGKTAMVDDSRGVRFIAYLLAHPGKSIPIATVLEAVDGQPKVAGSNGVLLDTQAQQAYRERLQELEEEIAEAKRFADLARHEHLCQEHETIVTELTATQGLKGRQRVSSDTDRFRRKVKMAISRSMDFFKGRLPEFYHHLRGSLHTGFTLCYAPDTTIPWTL